MAFTNYVSKIRKKTEEEIVAADYKYDKMQEAYQRLEEIARKDEGQIRCINFLSEYRQIEEQLLHDAGMVFITDEAERQFLGNYDEDNMYYLGFKNQNISYDGRFMFPIRNGKGELNAWVGYDYDSESKYLVCMLGISDKKHLMYGIDDIQQAYEEDTIIVNEGLFERVRLKEIGLNVGTSLLGKKMSDWHKQFLNRFKNVILIPDGDKEGQDMVEQWQKDLTSNVCVVRLKPRDKKMFYIDEWVDKSCKDLDDILRDDVAAQERFKELYKNIKEELKTKTFMEVSFT